VSAPEEIPDSLWSNTLVRTAKGEPKAGIANVLVILRMHPLLRGALAFNGRSQNVIIRRPLPWDYNATGRAWVDEDDTECSAWMSRAAGLNPSSPLVKEGVLATAKLDTFDAFKDYLTGVIWDGVPRLDAWLSMYAGAAPTPYHCAVGAKWVISVVARTFQPGCQVDTMLILEGRQGARKSSLLRALVGTEHFSDQLGDIKNKDAKISLQGPAVIEIAEMSGLEKQAVEAVKAFLTIREDRFRPPYGRTDIMAPRRVVFAGSTNPDGNGYLRDVTGGRRFWCVSAKECLVEAMERDRDRLWAEAVHRYRTGEPWWLSADLEVLARAEQEERREVDSWEEVAARALEHRAAGVQWHGRTLDASEVDADGRVVLVGVTDLLETLGVPVERQDYRTQARLGRVMRALGWHKTRTNRGGLRYWRYQRPAP
jgi:putative DNA primase/helicase